MDDQPPPSPEPKPEEPDYLYVQVGAVSFKSGENPRITFGFSMPNDLKNRKHLDILTEVSRAGSCQIAIRTLQQALDVDKAAKGEPEPADGPISGDPFPGWEKLLNDADRPVCACPEDFPVFATAILEDGPVRGPVMIVTHEPPCELPTATIATTGKSTADYENEVANAAGKKAPPPEPVPERRWAVLRNAGGDPHGFFIGEECEPCGGAHGKDDPEGLDFNERPAEDGAAEA